MKSMPRSSLKKIVRDTFQNTADHNIGKSAAALTYYLLFALFPLLIFISNLLGMLDLNVDAITRTLLPIMPDDIVYLLESYLNHITDNSSSILFWFSLVFTIWFPMRAARGLMNDVRLAYGLEKPQQPVMYAIRQFVFTIVFLVFIVVLFLLAILGTKFISAVTDWLGLDTVIQIPDALLTFWQYLRFVLVAALMFVLLGLLYAVAQDHRQGIKTIMPGVLLALVSWLLVSIGFSAYVEQFANYSVIYGTLGAVIVLLIWLYMTSFVLILGAEFNASLSNQRMRIGK